jgi:N-acetylneuraminic acid mutarotase
MKVPYFLCLVVTCLAGASTSCYPQQNEWSWMGGSELANQPGAYEEMGEPAAGNMPGARSDATHWVDRDGNVWVFGGGGNNSSPYGQGYLNDLWMLNPTTNEWTWIGGQSVHTRDEVCLDAGAECSPTSVYGPKGVFAPENWPGGRMQATGWVDRQGHFWMFGGLGIDEFPGKMVSWDCYLNEVWEFNPTTREWAWMAGSIDGFPSYSVCGQASVYGTLGAPSPETTPGDRTGEQTWLDPDGNFWIFGGYGKDEFGQDGLLDDLWKFDTSTKEWTWMGGNQKLPTASGSGDVGFAGVYGELGVPSPENIPGSRGGAVTWTDTDGNLWLFGGGGYDAIDAGGDLNDLWKYDTTSREWTWMAGPDKYTTCEMAHIPTPCPWPGVYGTLGVPSAKNHPGGRGGAASWEDSAGNIWLFGGGGAGSIAGQFGYMSDIWMFHPATSEWTWMGGPDEPTGCLTDITYDVTICAGWPGVFAKRHAPDASNLPGSRGATATWTDQNGDFWLFGGFGYDVTGNQADLSDLWKFQPSTKVLPPATRPLFSILPGLYSDGGLLKLSNGMPDGKIYYTTDGTTPTTGSMLYRGAFKVSGSETVKAVATAPGYRTSGVASATYFISQLFPPDFSYGTGSYGAPIRLIVTEQTPGATVHCTMNGTTPTAKSPVCPDGFTVAHDTTVSAIATKPGDIDSKVTRAVFTFLKPQTIDFAPIRSTVTYGTAPIDLVAKSSSGLPVAFNVLTGPATVDKTSLRIWGAGYLAVAADQGGNLTYDVASEVTHYVTVNPAKLRVTATSVTIKHDDAIPKLTYSMAGFVNGDKEESATTGEPHLTTTAKSTSPPGQYPIRVTLGTLAAPNYTFNFVDGTLTITK